MKNIINTLLEGSLRGIQSWISRLFNQFDICCICMHDDCCTEMHACCCCECCC